MGMYVRTDEWMNGRTNGDDSKGSSTSSRDQKRHKFGRNNMKLLFIYDMSEQSNVRDSQKNVYDLEQSRWNIINYFII